MKKQKGINTIDIGLSCNLDFTSSREVKLVRHGKACKIVTNPAYFEGEVLKPRKRKLSKQEEADLKAKLEIIGSKEYQDRLNEAMRKCEENFRETEQNN